MSKVLLINPPVYFDEQYVRGAKNVGEILPSLGLAYIAAYLENSGHQVRIIDGMAEKKTVGEIASEAKSFDMVGITSITHFVPRAHETAAAIKQVDNDIPIIMGGPHPTVLPFEVLEDKNVDYIVKGEGELTTLELVDAIAGKRDVGKVLGVAFRKSGKAVFNGDRPMIRNIDELPMPARHLLPMELYFSSEARSKDKRAFSMITSRGCTGNCSFCSNKEMFRRVFRAHSPERVVDEMEVLVDKYKAKEIDLWDDNFMLVKDRAMKVCDLMKERGIDVDWVAQGRVDAADYELLKKMKDSGCFFVGYGVESGSERILKDVGKNETKDQIRRAFELSKKVGMITRGYFMLGFVGETLDEMDQTIEFAKELDPDIATFTLLTPLPGTIDFERAQKEGEFDKDYYKKGIIPEFNFLDKPVYVPKGITAEQLMQVHRSAYRRFYLRPGYVLNQIKGVRSLQDIVRLANGALVILKA